MPDPSPPPSRAPLSPRGRALRAAVLGLRQEHRGWSFPPRLRIGAISASHVEYQADDDPAPEAALRADLVDALVERALVVGTLRSRKAGDAWVLRSGPLQPSSDDRQWLREVERAVSLRGLPVPHLLVITKSGWHDLRTGASRSWKRLRIRERGS